MTLTCFADLTSPQVAELAAAERRPVLLLPLGAVEPHGPHAPLGTDALISAGMCERAAALLHDDPEVRVLILPGLPYGVTRYAADFPGAVSVSEETLHALIVDVCRGLTDQGLSRVLIVNNHFEPEHLSAVRRAVETMGSVRGGRVGHLDLVRRRHAARLTEEFQAGECHAGRYETSLVLADHPELVDAELMRTLPRVPVDMPAAMARGWTGFTVMGMVQAYCGAPAEASQEEGAATFETLTAMLVEAIRGLL